MNSRTAAAMIADTGREVRRLCDDLERPGNVPEAYLHCSTTGETSVRLKCGCLYDHMLGGCLPGTICRYHELAGADWRRYGHD